MWTSSADQNYDHVLWNQNINKTSRDHTHIIVTHLLNKPISAQYYNVMWKSEARLWHLSASSVMYAFWYRNVTVQICQHLTILREIFILNTFYVSCDTLPWKKCRQFCTFFGRIDQFGLFAFVAAIFSRHNSWRNSGGRGLGWPEVWHNLVQCMKWPRGEPGSKHAEWTQQKLRASREIRFYFTLFTWKGHYGYAAKGHSFWSRRYHPKLRGSTAKQQGTTAKAVDAVVNFDPCHGFFASNWCIFWELAPLKACITQKRMRELLEIVQLCGEVVACTCSSVEWVTLICAWPKGANKNIHATFPWKTVHICTVHRSYHNPNFVSGFPYRF